MMWKRGGEMKIYGRVDCSVFWFWLGWVGGGFVGRGGVGVLFEMRWRKAREG
jgi:hypothetical protein